MIKTITQALFTKKAPPARRCVGEFLQGNLRARILVVPNALGLNDYWIDLDWYQEDERKWHTVGLLRCKLKTQLSVLNEVTDYLAKRHGRAWPERSIAVARMLRAAIPDGGPVPIRCGGSSFHAGGEVSPGSRTRIHCDVPSSHLHSVRPLRSFSSSHTTWAGPSRQGDFVRPTVWVISFPHLYGHNYQEEKGRSLRSGGA